MATAGDVTSGTATSTTTGKLVNSGAAFVSATALGKTVYNTTDDTFTTVTAYDSGTSLTLADDIMASGDSYIIGDPAKALTRICVVSGTGSYPMWNRTVKIKVCSLASDGIPLTQKTEGWLDENFYGWRTATGTPVYYIEEEGSITLVPTPDASLNAGTGKDTLICKTYRLPVADFTMDGSPEISEEYHSDLVHWMCALAYEKADVYTLDGRKRSFHEEKFEEKFGPPISARVAKIVKGLPAHFRLTGARWG